MIATKYIRQADNSVESQYANPVLQKWTAQEWDTHLAGIRAQIDKLQQEMVALPTKTKPDQETLNYWKAPWEELRQTRQRQINQMAAELKALEKV